MGEQKEADDCYLKVIDLDSSSPIAGLARKARSKLAQESFHSAMPGLERPDAVMYCLSALKVFEKMPLQEVQRIGIEIGVLGQKGLDTNDSTPKYRLKSLPGEFSGLHLLCYMFIAFKKLALDKDIGFDLSKEYELAKAMLRKGG